MYNDDDLLALSGLQHIAYCERQWALIHIEQTWTESGDTVRGEHFHQRVDTKGYSHSRGVRAERSVRVLSYRLGLYGIADIVEYDAATKTVLMPIEYKVGKPKIEDWDRIQVAAQVMCLEEMEGVSIDEGALFYGATRRREAVPVTNELRERVKHLAFRMHELMLAGKTPSPASSVKCRRCSLVNDCVPTSLRDAQAYWSEFEQALEVDCETVAEYAVRDQQ